jgi:hypothetical protein
MPKPTTRFRVREGWKLDVIPLTLNRARIIHTNGEDIDFFWCCESMSDAISAVLRFLADETMLEPDLWHRTNYGATYRRRPDMTPESEHEAP